jgi:tetratricopeptide (TPR) repeat protein
VLRGWTRQLEIAIEQMEPPLRLSPRARIGVTMSILGQALFLARRFDETAAKPLFAIQDNPSYPQPYRLLAACYAHMGRFDGARETIEQLRAIAPVVPDVGYLRNPEHRELFLSGLRLAAGDG